MKDATTTDNEEDFFDRMVRLGIYNHIGTDDEGKIIELPPMSGEEMAKRLIRLFKSGDLSADEAVVVVQDAVIHARSARDKTEWDRAFSMVKAAFQSDHADESGAS